MDSALIGRADDIRAGCAAFGIALPAQVAYVLATVRHETAGQFRPIKEFGTGKYFEARYGGRKDLGNVHSGDGALFCGRGYVQITGRRNYRVFGHLLGLPLEAQPDLALDHETALRILVIGFRDGLFTGRKLSDYVSGTRRDFVGARRCINGQDRARLIAGYAEGYLRELGGDS